MKTLPSLINRNLTLIKTAFILGLCSLPADAETIKANSYFPSPFGSYDEILLTPQAAKSNPCEIGTLYVQTPGTPYFCKDDGTGTGQWAIISFSDPSWTQSGNNVYTTDLTAKVAVGTSTNQFKLNINDGGIIAVGGTETLTAAGAGGRFIWYPKKAALRIGSVTGTQWDDANIGNYSSVAGGQDNQVSGTISTIAAGLSNTIASTANSSFIGGGQSNQVAGSTSAIMGGTLNRTALGLSFVGGGRSNIVSAANGTIIAGENNSVTGISGTIGAGRNNIAGGLLSTIVGGENNQANGIASFIGGGNLNIVRITGGVIFSGTSNLIDTTLDSYSIIGAGESNHISGEFSLIGAGTGNVVSGQGSIIGAGNNNSITNAHGGIASGDTNVINDLACFIGAGENNNITTGNHSAILTGMNNLVAEDEGFIGAGSNNTISFDGSVSDSSISSGDSNTIISDNSFIGAGSSNTANGHYSAIVAGANNSTRGLYSFIAGGDTNQTDSDDQTVVLNGHHNKADGLSSMAGGKYMQIASTADYTFAFGRAVPPGPISFTQRETFNIYLPFFGIRNLTPSHLIHLGGGAYSDGATWQPSSSVQNKENIQNLSEQEALDAFQELTPVTFNYKQNKEEPSVGFIAEDVPDLVAMKDRKGLQDMDIIAVLVKTAQHQQKVIEENEKALEVIKRKLEK